MSYQRNPNANDWLINYHKTPQSSFGNSSDDNYTKFPKTVYRWTDAQGQKHQKELYQMHSGGKYMEINIDQTKAFKVICNDAGWHGPQRFTYFSDLVGGEIADHWEDLMTNGDDIYDPANQDDDDDFDTAIRALFIKITGETMPGNVQHQRIMETKYANTKVDNQLPKPTIFWRRKSLMWKNAEFYGRVGPPIQDEAILHAEFYGLPLAARDWLKDDATGDGVDVFDAENNGAEMFTPADMFGLLDKWHKKLPASEKNGKGGGHNDRKPGDNNNRNNNNNNHRNDDERKRKHNHRDRGTKRQKFNNNNNETKKASDFDTKPCPIHGGHQWMDCRLAHGKKNFNEQQANNFAQRAGAETRDKFAWWFTTHEKKDWWKKKTNGGVTQQQYFGGQPYYPQPQQQHGSYYQLAPPPHGIPPAFPQGAVAPPPPPSQGPTNIGSYASGLPNARPLTKTVVYNPQTGQWI
jgi:hypothetical protein